MSKRNSGDDDARTWRDLTDQLTREQIAELQANEADGIGELLLSEARTWAEQNMIESIYSPDPLPADATRSTGWYLDDDGKWSRGFTGSRYVVEEAATETVEIIEHDDSIRRAPVNFWVSVDIQGVQPTDGTVNRVVILDHGPTIQSLVISDESWDALELPLSADAARRVAGALTTAADEIDKLS